MPNDKIFFEIVSSLVRTRTEANLLLAEVDVLLRAIYKVGDEDLENALSKSVRINTALAIKQALIKYKAEDVLKKVKESVNSLTFIELTLAYEPTGETIDRLMTWIKQNVGENVAIEIHLDKRILGGATIEYKGRIVNSTLLPLVNQYFQNNHVNL